MALFLFTKAILAGEPIKVFNHGHQKRSFTYIDDMVEGVIRALDHPRAANSNWNSDAPDPATSNVPCRIFNIGNESYVELLRYFAVLAQCLSKKAVMELLPLHAGDVPHTEADVSELTAVMHYRSKVSVEEGAVQFGEWYGGNYRT